MKRLKLHLNNDRLKLPIEDLKDLSMLLEIGMDLKSALMIIDNDKIHNIIEKIIDKLKKGLVIEEIYGDFINSNKLRYLGSFLNYLPFEKSLAITIKMYERRQEFIKRIVKKTAYPIAMMLITIMGVYLFNVYAFNLIETLASSFKLDISNYQLIRLLINLGINTLLIILLLVMIGVWFLSKSKHIVYYYHYISNLFPNTLLNVYITDVFINYYLQCYKVGLNTEETLMTIKSFDDSPIIKNLAYVIDKNYLKGMAFDKVMDIKIIDQRLKRFINIAYQTNTTEKMLAKYLDFNDQLLNKKIKQFSNRMQICSYTVILLGVFYIYRLLLLPMNMINNF